MIKRLIGLLLVLVVVAVVIGLNQFERDEPIEGNYVKVTTSGEQISPWAGPWSCVFDKETGLLWEVKTDSETIHDAYWSYSWFDGENGEPNMGDCYFEEDRCDTLDLIRRTNHEKLCGVGGWRLPSAKELKSLLDVDVKPDAPMIAKAFFPKTKRGDYWASEFNQPLRGTYRYLKAGAFAVNFIDGKVYTLPYRNAAFLRLVSDEYQLNNP